MFSFTKAKEERMEGSKEKEFLLQFVSNCRLPNHSGKASEKPLAAEHVYKLIICWTT